MLLSRGRLSKERRFPNRLLFVVRRFGNRRSVYVLTDRGRSLIFLLPRLRRDRDLHPLAVAHDHNVHRLPNLGGVERVSVIVDVRYFLATEFDDDVAAF